MSGALPVGPVTLVCFAGAVVFAFLRARERQKARYNRVLLDDRGDRRGGGDGGDGGGRPRRPRLSAPRPQYTEEGEAHFARARRYRVIFFALGFGALAAAWFGL